MSIGNWIINEFTELDETAKFFEWWGKLCAFFENNLNFSPLASSIASVILALMIIIIPVAIISKIKNWFRNA